MFTKKKECKDDRKLARENSEREKKKREKEKRKKDGSTHQ